MNPRLFLAATAATALVGPLVGTASAQPAPGAKHPPVLTYKNSGGSTTIARGKTFEIRLEACGDCGDYWSYSHRPDSSILHQVGMAKTTPDAKPPAVGGNDHTVWTYTALHKGRTTIRIVERSAEDGRKIIKRFSLSVLVD